MSHRVKIVWENDGSPFEYKTYSRDHEWHYQGGVSHPASAAADYLGSADLVDPEQAFTAALSSCHMLTFLALAATKGFTVTHYEDEAEGFLEKNDDGRLAMTRVILRPNIRFDGEAPDAQTLEQLHHRSHKGCFIANSVTTKIDLEAPNSG